MNLDNIRIVRARKELLKECSKILEDSELGQKYFLDSSGKYIGEKLLSEGFENSEVYVSLNDNQQSQVIGFSWIQERGIFNWFPFLHVVAIASSFQGQGYGKLHMKHFEKICIHDFKADKGFLMVGQYNAKAIKLYKDLGYEVVGNVPNLFVNGINETLMYKEMKL